MCMISLGENPILSRSKQEVNVKTKYKVHNLNIWVFCLDTVIYM